jgi:hypothetical protein
MTITDSAMEQVPAQADKIRSFESITPIMGSLTLVTALLGYIGWIRTRSFYSYFGLSPSLVSFSPQDYVLRSADVSFGGALLLALAGAALLILDRLIARLLDLARHRGKWGRHALVGAGAVLVLFALCGATSAASVAIVPPLAGAVLLGLGAVLLLRFGAGSARRPGLLPPAGVGLSVAVLALAGFWAATVYAQNLGVGAAKAIDRDLDILPAVTIYSREPIDLPGANVAAMRVLGPDQQWQYRYTGPRLLTYSNSRWFLIPEPSSPIYRSSVTVIQDDQSVRVEMAKAK